MWIKRIRSAKRAAAERSHEQDGEAAPSCTIGRSYAIADLGPIRLADWLAWLIWAVVHLLLIGFRNRSVTLFQWAWSCLTFERRARLVSYKEEEALRSRGKSSVPLVPPAMRA